jgi:hypothetical protein
MELVMKIFFNIPAVPLNTTKPILNGRIVGGNETDITSHPYQVWPLRCCSVWRCISGIWTKETSFLCNDEIIVVKEYFKKR